MTTDITTLRSMRQNLAQFRASNPRPTGGATGFLKFSKGHWSFGKDNTPLDLDGSYILHPQSLMHGWICWRDGKIFGKEVLVPFTQQLPLESSLPVPPEPSPDSDDAPGYQYQTAMTVVGHEGKQAGQQFQFKTASVGGTGAMGKMVEEVMARMEDVEVTGEGGVYAVLAFDTGSYEHKIKSRGRVYFPTIEVIGWSTNEPGEEVEWLDGAEEDEVEEIAPPPPVTAGRKRIAKAS